jgi:hypothetical protein
VATVPLDRELVSILLPSFIVLIAIFTSLIDTTMVIVIIGEDGNNQVQFNVHLEHLTSVSNYFTNAFTDPFFESNSKTIRLSDVTPTTFRVFHE